MSNRFGLPTFSEVDCTVLATSERRLCILKVINWLETVVTAVCSRCSAGRHPAGDVGHDIGARLGEPRAGQAPPCTSRTVYCSRATDSPLKGCGLRSMLMLLFPCRLSLSTTICPIS